MDRSLFDRSTAELVEMLKEKEAEVQREQAQSLAAVAVIDRNNYAAEMGYRNTAEMLESMLRVTKEDAEERVARARELYRY
jgi:hypothetical protein